MTMEPFRQSSTVFGLKGKFLRLFSEALNPDGTKASAAG